jgi:iron complex outermembrane receptor protein
MVMIVQTGETVETDHEGSYRIANLKSGTYDIFSYVATYTSQAAMVELEPGATVTVDFVLELTPIHQSVTVTASGKHETTFEAVQTVTSLEAFDIAEAIAPSIGEVLDGQPGVAKRSSGPGSARPIIRGFDGDRVLVMRDGMRVGSLGSQSSDHGEPIDPISLERLEVVKGPATLLYGSNAIGGVVNAITRHHEMHKHRHEGLRGQLSGALGSNNSLFGGGGIAEYGVDKWMVWGGGGAQRTGDYSSAEGIVENSKARVANVSSGIGWFDPRGYFSFGYNFSEGRYGVPYAEERHSHSGHEHPEGDVVDLDGEEEHEEIEAVDVVWDHHNMRFNGGFQQLDSFVEAIRLSFNYSLWHHDELEQLASGVEEAATTFDNRELVYRADFDHADGRILSGTFGLWGLNRDYEVVGEEALSPPVDKNALAVFGLEELAFERVKLQLGGRLEYTHYNPLGPSKGPLLEMSTANGPGPVAGLEVGETPLPERDFTGFSFGAGARFRLTEDDAFVFNFSSSFRAPALEELYNYGPHLGNLAFEIGNPDLTGERSNGVELSLRHAGERLRAEANFFYYGIDDFIFGAPTGEIEDGLTVLVYAQGDARFVGLEAGLDVGLHESIWLNLGLDAVDAELRDSGTPLPRIPPLRGRIGVDFRPKGFSFRPELVLGAEQDQVFPTETSTAGYVVVNLKAAYTLPQRHFVHNFSFEIFNIGNELYRNSASIIKDVAPEMGRGVKFSYVVKFF